MEKKGEVDETNMVWELKQGEQLTPEDIERSMADPDIRPASLLHGADESSHPSFQLYFGPGFEERLELEMDEYVYYKNEGDCMYEPCILMFFISLFVFTQADSISRKDG